MESHGLKLAVRQVFFKCGNINSQKMFDIEASKKVGDLATSEKSEFGKTVVNHPTSEGKGHSPKKLAQFYYYATLQPTLQLIQYKPKILNKRRSTG